MFKIDKEFRLGVGKIHRNNSRCTVMRWFDVALVLFVLVAYCPLAVLILPVPLLPTKNIYRNTITKITGVDGNSVIEECQ